MKFSDGELLVFSLWSGIILGLGIGWFINVAKLLSMEALPLTGLFIVRIIGIFVAPLGGVIGYF
jgi:hypothetical protein